MPNFAIGSQDAVHLRSSSASAVDVDSPLSTVSDLLNRIDPSRPKRFPMLWTTASHVAECTNVATSDMRIGTLREVAPDYEVWLKERRYSAKSISTFMYNLRRLLDKADELGCTQSDRALREAWQPIAQALKRVRLAPRTVPHYATSRGKYPADFTTEDLEAWGNWMVRRGRKHRTVRIQKGLFKKAVSKADLQQLLPRFDCERKFTSYGIPTAKMPEPLQSQVKALLVWKQAKFVRGRPQKTRHRAISAKLLENVIGRLYGFATGIAGKQSVKTLPELFCEDIVSAFAEWAVNQRALSRGSLLRLSMVYSALRHHPEFKKHDYTWFSELCDLLPEDDREEREARKAKKKVSYEVLCRVPGKIISSAPKTLNSVEEAWLFHDHLLICWFLTMVWRQRNVRECRLGNPETDNLFLAPLDPFIHIARPAWVEEILKTDPEHTIWQFYFRKDETKTDQEIRGIVPGNLVPLLEQYLSEYRPRLVSTPDPRTLFLNREGGALDGQTTTDLVAELTLKHTGVRVTPHIIRDIFAYAWLDSHPQDFLTLSKALWHQSLKYTLETYGSDYDETNAICRVDEWLSSRTPK